MRKSLIQILALFIVLSSLFSCGNIEKENIKSAPNIIFIMSDDHAYQAVSCYGDSLNETPNIDRLAKEGVRFNNSFCTNSICGPSRAVMLTGKLSHINGHIDNHVTFDGTQQTFPKLLQKAGYQTAIVGKWHLKSDPTGFDYWNIVPGQGHYYNPDFIENGNRKRVEGYVTDITTDIALDWIEKRDDKKPFCLLLHHKAPHRNWMPSPENLNKYDSTFFPVPETFFDDYSTRGSAAESQKMGIDKDMFLAYDLKLSETVESDDFKETRKKRDSANWNTVYKRMNDFQKAKWDSAYSAKNMQFLNSNLTKEEIAIWKYQRYMQDYMACIASVDENIGRVINYLEKENLLDNTIIVYTSDQGFYLGEHGWFDKRFMYEQSLRMPLIIRYPEEISPRVDNEHLVMNLDFAPTILDYAGVDIPDDIQGKSMRKILKSDGSAEWRDAIYYRYYEYPAEHSVKRHYGIRTDRYKLIHFYFDDDYWELYDLLQDPQEVNNLYNQEKYSELIDTLKVKLKSLQKEYRDSEEDVFLPKPDSKIDHLAKNCQVILKNPCNKKYNGGSKNALTDGVLSHDNGSSENGYDIWQGFDGTNLDAVVEFGKETMINSISCGFLCDESSWIFLPKNVKFFISNDGVNYQLLEQNITESLSKKAGKYRQAYSVSFAEKVPIKYLKVVAENIGVCPDWHDGAGSKAWLFADEIVVK